MPWGRGNQSSECWLLPVNRGAARKGGKDTRGMAHRMEKRETVLGVLVVTNYHSLTEAGTRG